MKKPGLLACRRTVQTGVALAFIVIPWLNHVHISFVYGNFLSFHLLKFPLADPLAVLQVTSKNGYLSGELLVGAGIALAIAAGLGTIFCAWACPFGLLSEWGQTFSKWLRGKSARPRHPAFLRPFRVKITLFLVGLAGFFTFSTTPVLNQLSLPAWYSRIFQFWFEQRHVSLAIGFLALVLAVEILAGSRLWCRYICPQSVLIGLAKQLNQRRLRVHFHPRACICKRGVDPCGQACTLQLNPKRLSGRLENQCTNCGDCVAACAGRGKALTFRRRPEYMERR